MLTLTLEPVERCQLRLEKEQMFQAKQSESLSVYSSCSMSPEPKHNMVDVSDFLYSFFKHHSNQKETLYLYSPKV